MASNKQVAEKEELQRRLLKEWIQGRIANIHERVTIYDVLRKQGVSLEYEDRPSQFSCPVHGRDTNPSARAYPSSGGSPSHAWCFVCQERWDAISLWKRLYGSPEKKFTTILTEIEVAFSLERPEFPDELQGIAEYDAAGSSDLDNFHRLEAACERRLVERRKKFDLKAYLGATVLLERVGARVRNESIPVEEGEGRLRKLLDFIGKKERECRDG
jgi:hypothetical protein